METRASYILVGSFVLGLIAVGTAFVVWLAKVEFDKVPTAYAIDFSGSVTGLQIGSAVRYRGVPVGAVTSIRIDPKNIELIRVVIEVADHAPITTDTVATLGLQGITGIAFIQLTGGNRKSQPLKKSSDGTLAQIPSKTSGIEQVLEKAPELFSKAVLVADRLSALVDDKNLKAVQTTLANLQNISSVIADRTKTLDKLMVESGSTLKAVKSAANSVDDLSKQLSRETGNLGGDTQKAVKELQSTMKTARRTLSSITNVASELQKMVKENRLSLKDFSSGGLYEFSQFIAEARVLVAGLTRLSGQIERDPARFFFGDTQKGFEAK